MAARSPVLKYITSTKVGEKGQLTVPKEFRKDLRLVAGAPVAVLRMGNGLILLPEQQRFERLCQDISSRLTAANVTPDDLLASLPDARNRVYARRYGRRASRRRARR
jgi:AbrB family looped-hinge helix DNA binding protein